MPRNSGGSALPRDTTTVGRFVQWLFVDPDFDVGTGAGAWVAERGGAPVGFVRATRRFYPNDRQGQEPESGWTPVIFVAPEHQRQGIGTQLLETALGHLRAEGARRVWVCGNTGSAPGYIFPGVDRDAYAGGLALFLRHGFVVDHEPVAMSRSILDFDHPKHHAEAWTPETSEGVRVETLRAETVMPFLAFLRRAFPGDWNTAARSKLRGGRLDEVLVAWLDDQIVGHCQWDGEHFGPFGVSAEARNRKIGAKLFTEAVRRIKADGGRTVWFNWADPDAARFYQRFGLSATRHFAILRKDLST